MIWTNTKVRRKNKKVKDFKRPSIVKNFLGIFGRDHIKLNLYDDNSS